VQVVRKVKKMPFIDTPDESEYPWWAAAWWLDDGSPTLLAEYFLARRVREECPSELTDAKREALGSAVRESERRGAGATHLAQPTLVTRISRLISGMLARPSGERPAAQPVPIDSNWSTPGGRA
jgi:hypothetical protein